MDYLKIKNALTFDDVLLEPSFSKVLPRDADISTRLTNEIRLNIPLMSAAMDTVTESRMAIAIAQAGGIGIIHKNLTIDEQAAMVDKVKKYESVIISKPMTLSPEQKVEDALDIMRREQISGFPIVKDGVLVGILTNRDLRFETNHLRKISEIMTTKVITVPCGTSIEKAKEMLHKHRIEKLPVVDKKNRLKGLITVTDIEKREKYPDSCKDDLGRLRVGAAVGVSFDREARIEALIKAGADCIIIDTAHGHSSGVIDAVRSTKKSFNCQLIAGNIATAQAAEALIKAGVDAIKVGVGPGSICTTRIVTGIGVPQITAVSDCVAVARKKNIPVISDGGIKYSGDITKALAAGADSIMIGGLFAGTDESPGETILYQGRTFKVYRGMGSIEAMKKGSKDRYFQEDVESELKLVPEGIEGRVPHKGPIASTIFQLIGGLRAGMGYCGSRTIPELHEKARFVKITSSGLRESHVHDVTITKEAPNYKQEA
ncbi:MAG: IMP dehydrogenase [Deltaproteobacteria bacterium GWB2_55_19]|nr:MAG: IMP dehydrogenase [Deltaproteobacteria bacterium GWB2_55_19]HAO93848.1 IMP dehydrogenase [Deltaproteobacteria bacterium]